MSDKMMKRKWKTAVLLLAMAMAVTACGSGGKYESAADAAAYESDTAYNSMSYAAAEMEMPAEAAYEEAKYEETGSGPQGISVQPADRKLIKTVSMNVETEQYDDLASSLESQVAALGGYIEYMSVDSREGYYVNAAGDREYLRYAQMTVRMPKENLEAFLNQVGEESNVVSRSESVEDVTLQYVDLESHKKALVTEQDRLLELMEQAGTVEDIITIEGRLSEVRYQIESMESQLRTYDNKIDYSTVHIYINEVERYTPSKDISVGEQIRRGFIESMEGVGSGITDLAIWFVTHIPYLVVWAAVIAIAWLIVRAFIRRRAAKRANRSLRQTDNNIDGKENDGKQ